MKEHLVVEFSKDLKLTFAVDLLEALKTRRGYEFEITKRLCDEYGIPKVYVTVGNRYQKLDLLEELRKYKAFIDKVYSEGINQPER